MNIRLGYDTYSLRSWKWNAAQHLDFASQQALDAIQFSRPRIMATSRLKLFSV